MRLLLDRYGTRASDVIAYLSDGDDQPLNSTAALSSRELEYMARYEQVGHLVDVLIRRTDLAFRGLVSEEILQEVSRLLAPAMGWDQDAMELEIRDARRVLQELHGVTVESLVA